MGERLREVKRPGQGRRLCRRGRRLSKCGCGGAPGCCICVDVAATVGQPCFYNYEPLGGKLCNVSPKCCCGVRVRATMTRSGFYHTEKNDGSFTDLSLEETLVIEQAIVKNGGVCVVEFTPVSYRYEYHRVRRDHEGNTFNTDTVYGDEQMEFGVLRFAQLLQNPYAFCRPEPVDISGVMLFYSGDPVTPEYLFRPLNYFDWREAFLDQGCAGSRETFDNFGRPTLTEWQSSAGCKSSTLRAESRFTDAGKSLTYSEQTGTTALVTLDPTCCPEVDPIPGLPGANPPGNPGNPGNPGAVTDGGCGSCGHDGGAGLGEALGGDQPGGPLGSLGAGVSPGSPGGAGA